MKLIARMITITGLAAALVSCSDNDVKTAQNEDFKYLVDEFADLKIMRYQVPGWDELSLQQKKYVYHLAEAAKAAEETAKMGKSFDSEDFFAAALNRSYEGTQEPDLPTAGNATAKKRK
jgi:dipeptidyl-peptidase-3